MNVAGFSHRVKQVERDMRRRGVEAEPPAPVVIKLAFEPRMPATSEPNRGFVLRLATTDELRAMRGQLKAGDTSAAVATFEGVAKRLAADPAALAVAEAEAAKRERRLAHDDVARKMRESAERNRELQPRQRKEAPKREEVPSSAAPRESIPSAGVQGLEGAGGVPRVAPPAPRAAEPPRVRRSARWYDPAAGDSLLERLF